MSLKAELADRTYIHGPPDVYNARSLLWRLIWTLVLLIVFCPLCYQLWAVGMDYKNDLVGTKVGEYKTDKIETVEMCPFFNWIDTNNKSINMTFDDARYFTGFFPMGPAPQQVLPLKDVLGVKAEPFKDLSTAKKKVRGMLKNTYGNSIVEMAKAVSLDTSAVIKDVTFLGVTGGKTRKTVNYAGTCYEVKLEKRIANVAYTMMFVTLKDDAEEFLNVNYIYNMYLGGIDATGVQPGLTDEMGIIRYKTNRVIFAVRSVKRYAGRSGKRCKSWTRSDQRHCYLEYLNNHFCKHCKTIVPPSTREPEMISDNYCNLFDGGIPCHYLAVADEEMDTATENACPQPCNEKVYDMTVSLQEYNKTMVYLMAASAGLSTEVEEYPLVTFVDFLANIGGTTGLYFGVSVISILQIFFIAMERGCGKRKPTGESDG